MLASRGKSTCFFSKVGTYEERKLRGSTVASDSV